jgi:hypothetical protein
VDAGRGRRPCRLEAAEEDDASLGHQDSASTDNHRRRRQLAKMRSEAPRRRVPTASEHCRPGTGSLALSYHVAFEDLYDPDV